MKMEIKHPSSSSTPTRAPSGSADSSSRGKWLLSLADLMTLLLAVIIVSANLGSGAIEQNVSSPRVGHANPVGTAFAQSEEYTRREIVNFYPEDFGPSEKPLSENALKRLNILKEYGGEHPTSIRLKSCFEGVGEMGWHSSLSQVLTLYRQVFDGSDNADTRRISFLGPHCEAARVPYLGASVTVEMIWGEENG